MKLIDKRINLFIYLFIYLFIHSFILSDMIYLNFHIIGGHCHNSLENLNMRCSVNINLREILEKRNLIHELKPPRPLFSVCNIKTC